MTANTTIQIAYADSGIALAARGPLVAADVGQPLTSHRIAELRRLLDRAGRAHGPPLLLGVFDMSHYDVRTLGQGHVRTELQQLFGATGPALRGIAATIEGAGLVAGTVRSTMAALAMLARSRAPFRVFATRADAVAWLATLGPPGGADEADALLDALRRARRATPAG